MIAFSKAFYWVAMIASGLGVLFAFMKDAPLYAIFDAGMGAWFMNCLMEIQREERRKK